MIRWSVLWLLFTVIGCDGKKAVYYEASKAPQPLSTETNANASLFEIEDIAQAVFALASLRGSIRGLASCAGRTPYVYIEYIEGPKKTELKRSDRINELVLAGLNPKRLPIKSPREVSDHLTERALYVEITRKGANDANATISSPALCGAYGMNIKRIDGHWNATWVDNSAHSNPESWQCRRDADCKPGHSCDWTFETWDKNLGAWIGRDGVCLRVKRCTVDKDCPKDLRCRVGEPVISELTGEREVAGRCLPPDQQAEHPDRG